LGVVVDYPWREKHAMIALETKFAKKGS